MIEDSDRAVTLLKATLQILQKCRNAPCIIDVLGETAFYDGTDCDGYCLMDDIKCYLEEIGIDPHTLTNEDRKDG